MNSKMKLRSSKSTIWRIRDFNTHAVGFAEAFYSRERAEYCLKKNDAVPVPVPFKGYFYQYSSLIIMLPVFPWNNSSTLFFWQDSHERFGGILKPSMVSNAPRWTSLTVRLSVSHWGGHRWSLKICQVNGPIKLFNFKAVNRSTL